MGFVKIGESNAAGVVDVAACYSSHMPYVVTIPGTITNDRQMAMIAWCTEEFGARGLYKIVRRSDDCYRYDVMFQEYAQWSEQVRWFYFKDPDHAVMFRMVWG